MKLSISNIAWSIEDDESMYSYLNQVGFSGLEIAPTRIFLENPFDKVQEAIAFKEKLHKKYNLEIASMQAICFGRNEALFGEESERNSIIEYIKKAIDFAQVLGCKNLVFGSPKNRIIKEGQHDLALSLFLELGIYSEKRNTTFAIEPNPAIYGTNFLNTTQETIAFVKENNSKGLKVNIDLGTLIHNKEDLGLLQDNINLINHIHVSEPYLEQIKEREIHLELYKMLKKSGYQKYISIEMKNLNDIQTVKETINYIKSVFNDK